LCLVVTPEARTLYEAGTAAFAGFQHAKCTCIAGGFQIRDMSLEATPIVARETIDEQIEPSAVSASRGDGLRFTRS
jgi:hypothetical protein